MAEYSLQHYGAINKTEELHLDAHTHSREREKGVFHHLSEFQFVLVKIEGVSAQDIRAGQCGAGAGHRWLSAHRCRFRSGSAEIHLLPVHLEPQSRLSSPPSPATHTRRPPGNVMAGKIDVHVHVWGRQKKEIITKKCSIFIARNFRGFSSISLPPPLLSLSLD